MLCHSKQHFHLDTLDKEDYDDLSSSRPPIPAPTPPPVPPPLPQSTPKPKRSRGPTAYNLFVSSLPGKVPNRFVYAANAWKEFPAPEKERMRVFLMQHMEELKDIHPDSRDRFTAITKLWILAKN